MGHIARLRKVGGSVMVAIPPAALAELNLKPEADVQLSVKGGRLVIDPKPRRRYSLDELLARCRPSRRVGKEDAEWLSGAPKGREIL